MDRDKNLEVEIERLKNFGIYVEGHSGSIICVANFKNSDFFLTGSTDKTLRLWNLQDRKQEFIFHGHTSEVFSVCISQKDEFAVSASGACSPEIISWDLINKRENFRVKIFYFQIKSLEMTENDSFFCALLVNCTINIWNSQNGNLEKEIDLQKIKINRFCFINDRIYIGTDDGKLKMFNNFLGLEHDCEEIVDCKSLLKYSENESERLEISNTIDKGSLEKNEKFLKNIYNNEELSTQITSFLRSVENLESDIVISVPLLSFKINCMCFNSSWLLFGAAQYIFIYNIKSNTFHKIFKGHSTHILSVYISKIQNFVVSISRDSKIICWDIFTLSIFSKKVLNSVPLCSTLNFNETCIITGYTYNNNPLLVHSLSEFELKLMVEDFFCHIFSPTILKFSEDLTLFVSGSRDSKVIVWNMRQKKGLYILLGHFLSITGLDISKNNRYIVSTSLDQTIKLWDLANIENFFSFEGHSGKINCVKLAPCNKVIISASYDKTLRVWNTQNERKNLCTYQEIAKDITSICFTDPKKFLMCGVKKKTVYVIKINSFV